MHHVTFSPPQITTSYIYEATSHKWNVCTASSPMLLFCVCVCVRLLHANSFKLKHDTEAYQAQSSDYKHWKRFIYFVPKILLKYIGGHTRVSVVFQNISVCLFSVLCMSPFFSSSLEILQKNVLDMVCMYAYIQTNLHSCKAAIDLWKDKKRMRIES